MRPALEVALTSTFDLSPLAVVSGLPGDGAELRPAELRNLAAALLRIAGYAEGQRLLHRGELLPAMRRVCPLS